MTDSPLVLHVIANLAVGGAERMLATLAMARRMDVRPPAIACLIDGGPLAGSVRSAGIAVHALGVRHPVMAPIGVLRLARLIRRLKPDVIQSWMYYGDLVALAALVLSGRRRRTRLYWGVRCSDMNQAHYGLALRWTIATCARLSGRPDAVIANSFAGRDYHASIGYRRAAFHVIPNGIDVGRFAPDPEARAAARRALGIDPGSGVVLHVGRVDPMKDHASLVAVAEALPQIVFLAAGAGTERLPGPPNLRRLGLRDDIPRLATAADLILSTSAFGEGFSNALAEGMASGLPAVATDVGDARRIVGESGRIVRPLDRVGMIAAVRDLMSMPAFERAAMGAAARRRIVERFSLDRVVAAFDMLHREGHPPACAE